jgi:hypothetical protein
VQNDVEGAIQVFEEAVKCVGWIHLDESTLVDASWCGRRTFPEDTELLASAGAAHLRAGSARRAFECFGGVLAFDSRQAKVSDLQPFGCKL